jgi:hypothetical protein
MTNKHLYIFSAKDMSLTSHSFLSNIYQILQVTTNQSLVVLKMEDKKDLFIETIQRNKFMVYLLENAARAQLNPPKIVEALKLNLGGDKKKKKNVVDFKNEDNNKSRIQKKISLQRNFICLSSVFGNLHFTIAK